MPLFFASGVTFLGLARIIEAIPFPGILLMTEVEYNNCVRKYADPVYRFVLKNLRHVEDARDVVQSAFEKLWLNRSSVENATCKSYLFTVAYHQMIDHIRRQQKMRIASEPEEDYGNLSQHTQGTKKVLEEALRRLSDVQRSLVLLKDYEGYSYAEIGQITGLHASQVKVYLHRARIQMRDFLVSIENVI